MLIGQLYALAAAFFFALSSVCIAKGSTGKGDQGVIFSVLVTLGLSLLLWLVVDRGQTGAVDTVALWRGIFWFAVAGVFAMVLGRTFIYASVRRLGVTRAAALKKATPFFSALLAFVLLGELLTGNDLWGMVLIGFAFVLLSRRSFQRLPPEQKANTPAPIDYSWGIAASFSYAMSFITRKYGLVYIVSPAFATFISALAGLIFFVFMSFFSARYRQNLLKLFSNLNPWLIAAAVAVSLGQICIFAALTTESVAIVAILSSLEVFIASFLSVVIFKAEKRPDRLTYLAALIAFSGAALISLSS
jgi:drug/metabolite transporter (DMT)-like permease